MQISRNTRVLNVSFNTQNKTKLTNPQQISLKLFLIIVIQHNGNNFKIKIN